MGFIKRNYNSNNCELIVSFENVSDKNNYFDGDSVQEALNYFNLYVKNNMIFRHTEEELIAENTGINTLEEAEQLRQELNEITSEMTDEEAIERSILFPIWKSGKEYTINERVRYGGRIFKVLQNHTSQDDWTPSRAPSLFAEILTSEDEEPQEWQQPSSTNPYLTGDKVIYNGLVYESLIDNNTWSPADYPQGWKLISEQEPEVPSDESTIPEWVQPDSTNPYQTGDKVTYNGHTYESTVDNNVWAPDVYGWSLIE